MMIKIIFVVVRKIYSALEEALLSLGSLFPARLWTTSMSFMVSAALDKLSPSWELVASLQRQEGMRVRRRRKRMSVDCWWGGRVTIMS